MSWFRRFSVYGGFWTKFLHWGVSACPEFLEPFFVTSYTSLFFLACGPQRRSVAANLQVLRPDLPGWIHSVAAFRVFWNFAWTQLESIRQTLRPDASLITWEVHGPEHLEIIKQAGKGVILLTAHMGSYDLAAPVFSDRLGAKVHAVRMPEREAETQDFMAAQRASRENEMFQVRYNSSGSMLGVELAKALSDGEWVAIQGDRVLGEVSPVEVPVDSETLWRLPRGPFFLALAAKAPMLPVFITRKKRRHYRVEFYPAQPPIIGDRDRKAAILRMARAWAEVLGGVIRRDWGQWYVFEKGFQAIKPESSTEKTAPLAWNEAKETANPIMLPATTLGMGSILSSTLSALVWCAIGWELLRVWLGLTSGNSILYWLGIILLPFAANLVSQVLTLLFAGAGAALKRVCPKLRIPICVTCGWILTLGWLGWKWFSP